MNQILRDLLSILSPERLEEGLFRGQSQDLGFGQVFGGQVIAQALSVAKQTVVTARQIHSLHGYFLRAGDERLPIIYDVQTLRDGGNFSLRRVKAIQKNQPICYIICSFQSIEKGLEHHATMPDVPGPHGLLNQQELALRLQNKIPKEIFNKFIKNMPIEMRLVDPINPINPKVTEPKRYVWMRANGSIANSDVLQEYLLAYISDFSFLITAAQPHGVSYLTPGLRLMSIDHAMWFHRPVDLSQWLLYSIDSPNASGGRGFVRGEFFNQEAQLVASTTQEGLMRLSSLSS